jgi:Mrp family chromosome partitioning ATPase
MLDLALERPELAAITMEPRGPGIADLVRGTASFGQIITRDVSSRVQIVTAGRVGSDAAMVYMSERLGMAADALARTYDHVVIDAGSVPYAPVDRIARLAPCAVLVATGLSPDRIEAMREQIANAGFREIAIYSGSPPTLDGETISAAA